MMFQSDWCDSQGGRQERGTTVPVVIPRRAIGRPRTLLPTMLGGSHDRDGHATGARTVLAGPALSVFLILLTAFASPLRAAVDDLELGATFREGSKLFQEANRLFASDPEQARDLYRKAALRFERVAKEGGVENGKLYYNIGNAWFRTGDIGRAILNYRRAEQFTPHDRNLQQNLDYARSQRRDDLAEPDGANVLRTLLFWHYEFSFGQRFGLFAAAFVALWVAAAVRLFFRRPFLKWVIGICGLLSLALGASLLVDSLALANHRPGVVLADEVVARKGDSESYEASFQEPLHAGAEFTLVEYRNDWLHVELPDGRRCWLPESAVELVRNEVE